ncbi:POT family proton-dependent oligopeptide transporter [Mycobacterium sp. MAA66]|uniref:peptide MFS transporter n=1 Tax=Mycobacterium sp. MAA66 TaxID=3156297 RepID=UPI0035168227
MTAQHIGDPRTPTRTILGHPIALANLFGVELWERFSFYGMLTILGYYLYYSVPAGGLGLPQHTATGLVGAYGALVYLCTVLGGWLADRLLGMERTIFYGGVVVMLGHLGLAVLPGLSGVGVGLLLIALGSGALKANASSLLGSLYRPGDTRTDAGFTLFYLGVNLGSLLGPLATGLLQTRAGFHYAFGAAAVGMALGLAQYVAFRRNLGNHGRDVPNPLPHKAIGRYLSAGTVFVTVTTVVCATGLVTLANLSQVASAVLTIAAIAYFVMLLTSPKVRAVERSRVRAFIPLFLASTVFFALFQQMFTVLGVYSDSRINWTVFGWHAPSNWIGSIEPVWVIILSPGFALLWTALGNRAASTPRKFSYGVMGMGTAFLLFVPMAAAPGRTVPAAAVAVILGVFAVSELLIAPIGLAVTTALAPQAFRSQMMALYFLAAGLGTALSGALAKYYSAEHEAAYFGILGGTAVLVGLMVFAGSGRITRLMAGVH